MLRCRKLLFVRGNEIIGFEINRTTDMDRIKRFQRLALDCYYRMTDD